MTALSTLTVRVLNAAGKDMFENPRFLRVIKSGSYEGKFAVARHGKAMLVTGIARPDAVTVDATAVRIDLALTRGAKLADIGVAPKVAAKPSPVAIPADLPALVAKYEAFIAKSGKVFVENMLTRTKDVVKREAMEIALKRKTKSKRAMPKALASEAPKAEGIDVNELAKAIAASGMDMVAFLSAIAKPKA